MPEIQDIFKSIEPLALSRDQHRAFFAIRNCRTDALGSHVDQCNCCNHANVSYNSCRNRHCPKCQGSKQKEWVNSQLSKLLPVGYFHLVFTLPQELNSLLLHNKRLLFSILMKSAGDTIGELAKDPKFLGAQIGVTAVLHTWGQNLSFHPHIHCLVPGGGLSLDGRKFITASKKFFIPVKVISRKFRGKFLFHLKDAWRNGKLKFFNEAEQLLLEDNFLNLISSLYHKEWVVYCKKPFKSPWHVVSYLGRYTHRVAISNSRIITFDDHSVSFKWTDYKDHNRVKLMTVTTAEFLRRFLLHVLPSGFTKLRHYGLLSSRNVATKLAMCMKLAGRMVAVPQITKHVNVCPKCGGVLEFAGVLRRSFGVP